MTVVHRASHALFRRNSPTLIAWTVLISLCGSLNAQGLATQEMAHRAPMQALDTRSRCLLDQLAEAADDLSVASLKKMCALAAPTRNQATQDAGELPAAGHAELAPVKRRFASENGAAIDVLGFMPHRPNYLLPATIGQGFLAQDPSAKPAEIMFQVSLKVPLTLPQWHADSSAPTLYFAYTGSAWWQAWDSKRSSPFREYNHSPEVFVFFPLGNRWGKWTARSLQLGFEHHSNGRSRVGSRSWNRIFTQIDLDRRSNHWLSLRSWWRIPEDSKTEAGNPEGDDNPDISRFYGHHELRFGASTSGLSWNVMLRRSLRSKGKGAAELNVSYPTGFNPKTRWFIRAFDGYGESLIDYNRRVRRLGFGVMLNDWY